MKALLSIKPEFANRIFDGSKRFEYRRVIFKQSVKSVVVYASAPISMVIGEFEVEDLLCHDLDTLWRKTSKYSGISKDYFYQYFSDKEHGYAIKVGKITEYKRPQSLQRAYGVKPPQSYIYLSGCPTHACIRHAPLRFACG